MTALTVRASVACVAQCSLPLRHVSEDEAIVNIDLGELGVLISLTHLETNMNGLLLSHIS